MPLIYDAAPLFRIQLQYCHFNEIGGTIYENRSVTSLRKLFNTPFYISQSQNSTITYQKF